MNVFASIGVFGLGLGLLLLASGRVISAAQRIGTSFGLRPAVSGLTIVAFATSSPELAVVLFSLAADDPDIATGSIAGSNIANILLVIGATASMAAFTVERRVRRFDLPVVVGVSSLAFILAIDRSLSRLDGLIFLTGLVVYLVATLRSNDDDSTVTTAATATTAVTTTTLTTTALTAVSDTATPDDTSIVGSRRRDIVHLVAATIVLAVSARLVVIGAEDLAASAGISQLIIGLTVVSIGTSLPEISTSLIAARHGQPGIAIGNAIGSNLFNVLLVLGISSLATSISIADSVAQIDLPVMIGAAILLAAAIGRTGRIQRWQGAMLLAAYATYIGSLAFHGS